MQQVMQAIIVTGGKQYNVSEGDTLFIEKLDVNAGDAVVFDQVLAIVDGENSKFGTPVVEGAKVDATVVIKWLKENLLGMNAGQRSSTEKKLPVLSAF